MLPLNALSHLAGCKLAAKQYPLNSFKMNLNLYHSME